MWTAAPLRRLVHALVVAIVFILAANWASSTTTTTCGSLGVTPCLLPSVTVAASSASITLSSNNLVTTYIENTTVTTATLPSAVTVGSGFVSCIKDLGEDFNAHNVTLKSGAGTIDGVAAATGIILNQTHQKICMQSDGTNWGGG